MYPISASYFNCKQMTDDWNTGCLRLSDRVGSPIPSVTSMIFKNTSGHLSSYYKKYMKWLERQHSLINTKRALNDFREGQRVLDGDTLFLNSIGTAVALDVPATIKKSKNSQTRSRNYKTAMLMDKKRNVIALRRSLYKNPEFVFR
jgi:hypothetical protein